MAKPKLISVKQLRENMPAYLEEIAKGKSFMVLKRSKPVFLMTPILDDDDDEQGWEKVIDFREINPDGVPIDDVLKALATLNGRQDHKISRSPQRERA